ncbi:uncharacterized protein LOC134586555 [Pelobates fuscus]|uniref:uncharacterized protein LOC134586555 n=1 Tax=Pelobates fuscus TaxID=191477 RepID=UPI002FE48035
MCSRRVYSVSTAGDFWKAVLAMEVKFLSKLALLVIICAVEVWAQGSSGAGILSTCQRSFVVINLPAGNVLNRKVQFSAIDEFGRAFLIDNQLASQCGYSISYDAWGNIEFRASLLSCYTQIRNDSYFTVSVKVDISTGLSTVGESNKRSVDCPYKWCPREVVCERSYMEVSVRRTIPHIPEGALQDEPEDWSEAFPEAVSGLMSIWQVVFHLTSTRKAMLVKDAQKLGYGINTTEARIILRAPYNATEARLQRVSGVGFSAVRATVLYKQRWFLLMADTAVSCPVDDVTFVDGKIIWTVPKTIPDLLIGASMIKITHTEIGVDLTTLTKAELLNRSYLVVDNSVTTSITIPYGSFGGYYKSRTSYGEYGIFYHIRMLLQYLWEDNRRGVTKYTVIKDIKTPFDPRPPTTTNETIISSREFNVTIGTFLPDVELVNLTIGLVTIPVSECNKLGCMISSWRHPNGNITYLLKVPFDNSNVEKQYIPEYTNVYTLNVTFGFLIIPSMETFTKNTSVTITIEDAVPPTAKEACGSSLTLNVTRGNVDTNWVPYIKNVRVSLGSAQTYGFQYSSSNTNFIVSVPPSSSLVAYDSAGSLGLMITLPLTLRDDSSGLSKYQFSVTCTYPANELIQCFPNGTISVVVMKLAALPDLDLSLLQLRARSCRPALYSDTNAIFIFQVNTCETSRQFSGNKMTYENDVLYFRSGSTVPAYQLKVSCNYTINNTMYFRYSFNYNPAPSVQTTNDPLVFILRLSKDKKYTTFYDTSEYPVVKYLKDPLYFEVELMRSKDVRLELFLENCWATASPETVSVPRWDVVVNSCEFSETYNTIFHAVTSDNRVKFPKLLKRFEVNMFTFMNADQAYTGTIYFHCSVVICNSETLSSDPICTGSCIPNRQRLGRSVDSPSQSDNFVSSEALWLTPESGLDTAQFKSNLAIQ